MQEPTANEVQPDQQGEPLQVHYDSPVRAIWRFLIAAVFLVCANFVAGSIAIMVLSSHPLVFDALYRALTLVFALAGFRFMLRVLDQEQGNLWRAMGLGWNTQAARDLLEGLAIGASMIAVGVMAMAVFGSLTLHVHVDGAGVRRLLIVTLLLLFGAMLEEVMFRGYPFQRLVESIGPTGAVLVLSALFGALHFSNPDNHGWKSWEFFNTLAVGALFAVAYLRTKSLWMPFGMHFAWNYTLGVLFGLPVSGLKTFAVIVRSTASGSRALTGGAYGIEGSLTGAIVILLGFVPVLYITRRHLNRAADNFSGSGI
jgi:membrane protease YdiL (CAAX protease family)